ncbi:hypothetical protein Mal52_37020 [Symmachiella dynata]|uniref:Uncharacterized protein n=1 Tax=Symmachiella dynata TaxID=2527995 RepID=A0A517ZRU9_9PLAN|nr:hypothetical protein Mal52_37020 [Symmachiella dynata]
MGMPISTESLTEPRKPMQRMTPGVGDRDDQDFFLLLREDDRIGKSPQLGTANLVFPGVELPAWERLGAFLNELKGATDLPQELFPQSGPLRFLPERSVDAVTPRFWKNVQIHAGFPLRSACKCCEISDKADSPSVTRLESCR